MAFEEEERGGGGGGSTPMEQIVKLTQWMKDPPCARCGSLNHFSKDIIGQGGRPGCPHPTMARNYQKGLVCCECGQPGGLGYVYVCTQDIELSLQDDVGMAKRSAVDGLGKAIDTPSYPEEWSRTPAARVDVNKSLSAETEDFRGYSDAQVKRLQSQRNAVIGEAADDFVLQQIKKGLQSSRELGDLFEWFQNIENTDKSKPWLVKEENECGYMICPACDRKGRGLEASFLSIDAVLKAEIPMTAAIGFGFHDDGERPIMLKKHAMNFGRDNNFAPIKPIPWAIDGEPAKPQKQIFRGQPFGFGDLPPLEVRQQQVKENHLKEGLKFFIPGIVPAPPRQDNHNNFYPPPPGRFVYTQPGYPGFSLPHPPFSSQQPPVRDVSGFFYGLPASAGVPSYPPLQHPFPGQQPPVPGHSVHFPPLPGFFEFPPQHQPFPGQTSFGPGPPAQFPLGYPGLSVQQSTLGHRSIVPGPHEKTSPGNAIFPPQHQPVPSQQSTAPDPQSQSPAKDPFDIFGSSRNSYFYAPDPNETAPIDPFDIFCRPGCSSFPVPQHVAEWVQSQFGAAPQAATSTTRANDPFHIFGGSKNSSFQVPNMDGLDLGGPPRAASSGRPAAPIEPTTMTAASLRPPLMLRPQDGLKILLERSYPGFVVKPEIIRACLVASTGNVDRALQVIRSVVEAEDAEDVAAQLRAIVTEPQFVPRPSRLNSSVFTPSDAESIRSTSYSRTNSGMSLRAAEASFMPSNGEIEEIDGYGSTSTISRRIAASKVQKARLAAYDQLKSANQNNEGDGRHKPSMQEMQEILVAKAKEYADTESLKHTQEYLKKLRERRKAEAKAKASGQDFQNCFLGSSTVSSFASNNSKSRPDWSELFKDGFRRASNEIEASGVKVPNYNHGYNHGYNRGYNRDYSRENSHENIQDVRCDEGHGHIGLGIAIDGRGDDKHDATESKHCNAVQSPVDTSRANSRFDVDDNVCTPTTAIHGTFADGHSDDKHGSTGSKLRDAIQSTAKSLNQTPRAQVGFEVDESVRTPTTAIRGTLGNVGGDNKHEAHGNTLRGSATSPDGTRAGSGSSVDGNVHSLTRGNCSNARRDKRKDVGGSKSRSPSKAPDHTPCATIVINRTPIHGDWRDGFLDVFDTSIQAALSYDEESGLTTLVQYKIIKPGGDSMQNSASVMRGQTLSFRDSASVIHAQKNDLSLQILDQTRENSTTRVFHKVLRLRQTNTRHLAPGKSRATNRPSSSQMLRHHHLERGASGVMPYSRLYAANDYYNEDDDAAYSDDSTTCVRGNGHPV